MQRTSVQIALNFEETNSRSKSRSSTLQRAMESVAGRKLLDTQQRHKQQILALSVEVVFLFLSRLWVDSDKPQ